MATYVVRDLLGALEEDPLRGHCPFSGDLAAATASLLAAGDDADREQTLGHWLTTNQPCIFGKVGAQRELISYCFLSEDLLVQPDQEIAQAIQRKRRQWKHLGEQGTRSAFVILALGARLSVAKPDASLGAIARKLASLYLARDVQADRIYHDTLRLWSLDYSERRRWKVGVNVFASAGDRRWWHDHRIPGGLAFSMNSVGHLVASEARRRAVRDAAAAPRGLSRAQQLQTIGAEAARLQQTSISSLENALKYAMHTIRNASEAPSGECGWGKATLLMQSDPGSQCPISTIRSDEALAGHSYESYLGWYHTDVTVPSVYFREEQAPPVGLVPHLLDFRYLHARGADHRELALGVKS